MKALARRCAGKLRGPLLKTAQAVLRRPGLTRYVSTALDRLPPLRRALRRVLRGSGWHPANDVYMPQTREDLSPETLAAYRALQAAFAQRQ